MLSIAGTLTEGPHLQALRSKAGVASNAEDFAAQGFDVRGAIIINKPGTILRTDISTTSTAPAIVESGPKRFVITAQAHDATNFNTEPVSSFLVRFLLASCNHTPPAIRPDTLATCISISALSICNWASS